ncbi:hypothetical protein HUG15_09910 [Salicibibacter cibarius]|uniref:Prealbumin-like fold domain-containing protein n=1 Tax=Salicibibacter cibarius TaxID=2743000 RepID=A0A7T6Z2L2_9BACI|nr:hypothetical protein [Salicibibacter cibarius]QQK75853.1 hypothetical protein HUG15_09910 [Salicibibacter cibarius]
MIKKCFAAFLMSFVVVFAFTGLPSTTFADDASAEYVSSFPFQTGDGQWDGQVASSNRFGVEVHVDAPLADVVDIRLCNADSGQCTEFKSLGTDGTAIFTNMLPGTYYGDIVSRLVEETSGVVTYRQSN